MLAASIIRWKLQQLTEYACGTTLRQHHCSACRPKLQHLSGPPGHLILPEVHPMCAHSSHGRVRRIVPESGEQPHIHITLPYGWGQPPCALLCRLKETEHLATWTPQGCNLRRQTYEHQRCR